MCYFFIVRDILSRSRNFWGTFVQFFISFTKLEILLSPKLVHHDFFSFFYRGKTEGHDIDLLISHPEEGCEQGVLVELMHRLDQLGMVLFGNITSSTYKEEVLKSMNKSNLTSTMDHFEKWMGIMKVNKSLLKNQAAHDTNQIEASDQTEANKDDVIPPSCKRNVSHVLALDQIPSDSLDHSRPKFEREKTSLTAAFDIARSKRDWIARRVDLIVCPASQYYYALVGWTGNRHYNR